MHLTNYVINWKTKQTSTMRGTTQKQYVPKLIRKLYEKW